MKCLRCSIDMLEMPYAKVMDVYGKEVQPKFAQFPIEQQIGHLTLMICPECGLAQFYVAERDVLNKIIDSYRQ